MFPGFSGFPAKILATCFPEDLDEAPFPDGASTVAMSDQVPPSDTSTALDQWDLVTHTSGDAQDKNEKLANVVYNEIKGQKRIRHNVDVCYPCFSKVVFGSHVI